MEDKSQVESDRQRAEVFDALGHPTRIVILKALREGALGFADLKKKTAIESSGHLQHHLTKLNGLIKNDEYGKYCLSDQGKDALLTVQTVENASGSGTQGSEKNYLRRFNAKRVLKISSLLLIALLIASSAIAIFEYNQTTVLQKENAQADRTISQLQMQLGALDTISVPSLTPHYLTSLQFNLNTTKIFLVSAVATYGYWQQDDAQISYPLLGSYALVIHKGDPCLIINVTVRNDYTQQDAGNSDNSGASIGNQTGNYASYIVLRASLFAANGSIINAVDFTLPKTSSGDYQFSLNSGETTSFNMTLATANRNIDHYGIYVGYLYSVPEP